MSILCAISNMLGVPVASAFKLGPELVVNGEFTDDISGWDDFYEHGSATWENGRMRIEPSVNSQSLQRQVIPVEPGKTYFVTGHIDARCSEVYNNVAGRLSINDATDAHLLTLDQGNKQSGVVAGMFTARADSVNVDLHGAAVAEGNVTFFDNVSVREIL
ncbi:MAG TPA: hypothetical protein ENI94_12810 [Gammaproteobacteria bacterium]|nr:hypothetical protein [Gammaproteobacteria bacterium]